jgi:hypothetical protein
MVVGSRRGLFRSFSRGALSAFSGKAAGKSFMKGAKVKVGPKKYSMVLS